MSSTAVDCGLSIVVATLDSLFRTVEKKDHSWMTTVVLFEKKREERDISIRLLINCKTMQRFSILLIHDPSS